MIAARSKRKLRTAIQAVLHPVQYRRLRKWREAHPWRYDRLSVMDRTSLDRAVDKAIANHFCSAEEVRR